jgi:hypothetical protein
MLKDLFKYTDIELPNDCYVKISPSQIDKFFKLPSIWYKENVLLEPRVNDSLGDTGRLLGTVLHKIYECVANNIKITREDIDTSIDDYLMKNPLIVANIDDIKNLYPLMSEVTVNSYVIPNRHKKVETEVSLSYKLDDGVYLAGTVDRIEDDTVIVDYKNESTKPANLTNIPFKYKIQMLSYAYLQYKNTCIKPNKLSVVYTIRPTKTLSARCFVVSETIFDSDWKLIEDTLQLMTESIIMTKKNPDIVHLIFKSMELKNGC